MTDPELDFSISCSDCGDVLKTHGQHRHAFDFLDWARAQGWVAPLAIENKPIVCPKCHRKP